MLLSAGKTSWEKKHMNTHEYIVELILDNIQSWFPDSDKCLFLFVAFEMITARIKDLFFAYTPFCDKLVRYLVCILTVQLENRSY